LRKKKNIRYKNSREKPLNQEIKPFPSENQTVYKKEDFQNQDVLIKDNMPAEVKTSSSKKTFINHPDRENKYKDLNKGSDSYEIPGKENINQDKSFLEPKKDKKVRQKQIGKFHQKEKETYEDLSKDTDKNIASNQYDMGFRNNKALQKALAKEQRYKENVATITTDKSKNKVRANRKRYKKILKENHDKEDLSLKDHSKKYFKSNFEDEKFTRTKNKKNPLNTKDGVKEKNDNKGEIADNSKPKPKEYSKKVNDKFRKQEKKILKLQHKKQSFEKKLENKVKDSISSKSAIVAVGAVNRYLESGKEDNAGVSAAHKTTDGIESLARKAHNHGKGRALKRQKRVVRLEKDIEKQEKKLFFKKNMEELKKSSEYQNTSRLRQFFKRRQYKKQLQNIADTISLIAGQKAVVTDAKKSVAGFKVREGFPVGVKVTLRKENMFAFLDKLISIALPRVKDFRGLPKDGFDGRGNYNFGLNEQLMFPEVEYDKILRTHGMNIVIVTTTNSDKEAFKLLELFGLPFAKGK